MRIRTAEARNSRESKRQKMDERSNAGGEACYRVAVTTGDARGSGIELPVYVMLTGSQGVTDEVLLNGRQQLLDGENGSTVADVAPLARGSTCVFLLRGVSDIGTLDRVSLRLDVDLDAVDTGAWRLERLSVERADDCGNPMGTEWIFSVGRWIDRDCGYAVELQRAMAAEVPVDDSGATVVKVRLAMHHMPKESAHEDIFVSGSIAELGDWNVERAVRMEKVMPVRSSMSAKGRKNSGCVASAWRGDWEYRFTLHPDHAADFEYKYFIRNRRTCAVIWEHGPNRKMVIERIGNIDDADVTVKLDDQWNTPTMCRKVLNSYLVNGLASPLSKLLGSSEDGVMHAVRRIRDELEGMKRENAQLRAQLPQHADQDAREQQLRACRESERQEAAALRHRHASGLHDLRTAVQTVQAALEQVRAEVQRSQRDTAELLQTEGHRLAECLGRFQRERDHALSMWRRESHWRRKLFNEVQELKGNIRVFCRARPCLLQRREHSAIEVIDADKVLVKQKLFEFDRVFGEVHTQEQVYEDTSPLVTSVMDGYNVCIFAYGQTGSGKTYTMSGPPESRGVNFRALEELFRIGEERSAAVQYTVEVSMLEIYNESLRDLIQNRPDERLDIKLGADGNPCVPDLLWVPVHSLHEVWEVMEAGSRHRAQGATRLNIESSRSHLVVSVVVQGVNRHTGSRLTGKLHLVDLAGSERVARSEAEGARLREAQHINKSLSALGDVFAALLAKQAHVPYRNSRLTHLLQDSLGGDSKTLMFVNVSPSAEDVSETLSSLQFAQRVARVELGAATRHTESADLNKYVKAAGRAQEELRAREEEVATLRQRVLALQSELRQVQARRTSSGRGGAFSGARQQRQRQQQSTSSPVYSPGADSDDKENGGVGERSPPTEKDTAMKEAAAVPSPRPLSAVNRTPAATAATPLPRRDTRAEQLRRQANECKREGAPPPVTYAFGSRVSTATPPRQGLRSRAAPGTNTPASGRP
ncbi:hypothetical protein CDCA_CDCA12G3448 [Cyanidium caldarium]|uniref:Kinesin-like protein n=1 Tax=Cyanidium caldarium TaxID=2771 RepID=A0AAV9J083_CYACA|nr:hypothetical protein CDCA_CDCA12G3448 [Cyanidium caldarium]